MTFTAKTVIHKGAPRIAVYFEKNTLLIARIKTYKDAKWSVTKKYWHVPDNEHNRLHFKLPLVKTLTPNNEGIESINNFKNHLLSQRYSTNTINTYTDALKSFLTFCNTKPIESITAEQICGTYKNY